MLLINIIGILTLQFFPKTITPLISLFYFIKIGLADVTG